MVQALGRGLDRFARRWMPDPFVLAVLLTFVVAIAGMALGGAMEGLGFGARVDATLDGWKTFVFGEAVQPEKGTNRKLLYFAFQMCLMLVTGHALASSPPVSRLVRRLAGLATSFRRGVGLVAFVACGMALVHWGLGLIVGAMIAREVGAQLYRRGIAHHYPLIGAAGYTGLMIWGGGLSGSIPLAAAGQKGIDIGSTLFSTTNLVISGSLLVAIPIFCALLVPRDGQWQGFEPDPSLDETATEPPAHRLAWPIAALVALLCGALHVRQRLGGSFSGGASFGLGDVALVAVNAGLVLAVVHRLVTILVRPAAPTETPAARLEHSELIVVLLCALALGRLEFEVLRGWFRLSFNNLNYAFLFAGLLFQGTPIRYVAAVADGAKGCAGIILQFPLYFGILGIMIATGLGAVVSTAMANAGTELTYPVLTYFSAGLVNLFVPSGGGQWVVQGSIIIDGAAAFPELIPKSILALAYGDALTNMLQPFWAVPLLAITRLQAREIIGYTAAVMVLGGALTVGLLLLL